MNIECRLVNIRIVKNESQFNIENQEFQIARRQNGRSIKNPISYCVL